MTRSEFLDMFAEVVQERPGSVTPNQTLKGLRHWDSLTVVAFMAEIDERLGAPISYEDLSACKTIDDVMQMFAAHLQG
jgi:acyl carrier protein